MRYLALATDYDGTLAHHGSVDAETVEALRRLAATGRKLILVTGRQVDDLVRVFPQVSLFDQVIGENGALIYRPQRRELRRLAEPPPLEFVEALKRRRVDPLAVGHVVVATVQPHETEAIEAIRELGLELQVIFNKGSVMILPASVNKASGLAAGLAELQLSPHNIVGIGDAENDHAFLAMSECGIAVANALDSVKAHADVVTTGRASEGVREVIESLIEEDLRLADPKLSRRRIVLGHVGEKPITISAYGPSLLIAGASGAGKSGVLRGFLERLADQAYQFCVVDPEGDYDRLGVAVTLGSAERAPSVDEAVMLLRDPTESVVINLVGLRVQERPGFFHALLPRVQELRAATGRPHWLAIDEAHHLLPESSGPVELTLPETLTSTILITVHPNRLARSVLDRIDTVVAIGSPKDVLRPFGQSTDEELSAGDAIIWFRKDGAPRRMRTVRGRVEQRRHVRKYAAGDLGQNSFHFRGPDGRLNLRAQNLAMFLQIAEGVDDETWLYHLRKGDYSSWFQTAVKDPELVEAARNAERLADKPAAESRRLIKDAIEQKYTAPA
ncbi:MAG TPA: HAD family hydrolase [Candidatus Angelobacter sp.]|nr:HAD family hydrolase [Candidatus Angelobacter sp.]